MTRRLLLAPFGCTEGTERLLKAVFEVAVEPRDILYLCPSPRRIDQAKGDFLRLSGRDALVPPRFATLRQLARDVHDRQGSSRRLPPELKPLLVQRVLTGEAAGRRPQASSTRPATADSRQVSIGYARAVADFIAQIRRYVPAQDRPALNSRFESLLAGFEKPLARCLDALAALGKYEAELTRLNWIDDEGIMAESAQGMSKDLQPKVLVLDSFVAPDRLEADLLRALGVGVDWDPAIEAFAPRVAPDGSTAIAGLLAAGEVARPVSAAEAASWGRRAGEVARG